MSGRGPILVVEDDDAIRESLLDFLVDCGYAVLGAVHGRDALEKLRVTEPTPSLIVLDLMMPVMDARAFRDEQLQTPALAGIPLIVMSAHPDLARAAGGVDAVAYLKKPLRLDRLLMLIQQHLPS